MTGQEIANNLKHSRRKWGTGFLFDDGEYCVLGIKAAEAGVSRSTLLLYENEWDPPPFSYRSCGVTELCMLNDHCDEKEELIRELESPKNVKKNFPVEKFVKKLLKWQETLRKQKT